MRVIQSKGRLEAIGHVSEAAVPIEPDEEGWRSLGALTRDLSGITLDRVQKVAFDLYQRNPLGHRLTELVRDFVVGDGITYSVTNPYVQEVVDRFWHDSVNRIDQRNDNFALELGLYGELAPEVFVGPVSGVTVLGYVDVGQIKKVVHLPRNPLVLDTMFVREKGFGVAGRPLQVIRDRGNGILEGDVFYWRVNAVSNASRGWPDLMHVADWLDAFDQLLWEMVERARLARSFIWDVNLKDADQTKVDDWLRRNGEAPRSGSVRAHNDQVQWSAVAPELGSFESAKESEVIKDHLAAGAGVPKVWLSAAEDVNRATATEMGAPTTRRLSRRQRYYLDCIGDMVRLVVERATLAGAIPTDARGRAQVYDEQGQPTEQYEVPWKLVTLQGPEISTRETARMGGVLRQVADGLAVAESKGWFGVDTSRRVVAAYLNQMGIAFDPAQEPPVEEPEEPDDEPATPDPRQADEPAPVG